MDQSCDNWVTGQIMLKYCIGFLWLCFTHAWLTQLYANEYQTIKRPVYGVVLNTVNVRQKPATTYKILGSLEKNQKVRVIGRYKKQWYHVIYNSKKAWVWSKNLRLQIENAQIKTVKKPLDTLEVIEFPSANLPKQNNAYQTKSKIYDRYQGYQ